MIEYFKKKVTLDELNQFYLDNYAIIHSTHSVKNQYSAYNSDKEKAMYAIEILRYNRSFNYEILYFLQERLIKLSSIFNFDDRINNFNIHNEDFRLIEKESNYEIEESNLITISLSTDIDDGFVPEIKTNTFYLMNNSLQITSEMGITNIKIILTNRIVQPINSLRISSMYLHNIGEKGKFLLSQKSTYEMFASHEGSSLALEVDNENLVIYSNWEYVYEK